jgi:hypothetical protein
VDFIYYYFAGRVVLKLSAVCKGASLLKRVIICVCAVQISCLHKLHVSMLPGLVSAMQYLQ